MDEDGRPSGHSGSWVTAKELLAYDWDQPLTMRATVRWETFEKLERAKRERRPFDPREYSSWSSDQIDEERARALIAAGDTVVPETSEFASGSKVLHTPTGNTCVVLFKDNRPGPQGAAPAIYSVAGKDGSGTFAAPETELRGPRDLVIPARPLRESAVATTWQSTVADQLGHHVMVWVLRLARAPFRPENVRASFNFDS